MDSKIIRTTDLVKHYRMGDQVVEALRGVTLAVDHGEFLVIMGASGNSKIGFVFQQFNLLARTTAVHNVALPLLYAGVGSSERRRRAEASLEKVGLGHRLGHYPNQMSGGGQQRVAIARALINDPPIIMADEPTGNLDTKSGVDILSILQELNVQGITLVMVTHECEVAEHGDRIVHVRDGLVSGTEGVLEKRVAPKSVPEPAGSTGGEGEAS